MKPMCERCGERAVMHITEIHESGRVQDVHLCYLCWQEYQRETVEPTAPPAKTGATAMTAAPAVSLQCPSCKLTFAEFRNTGRLGCPHDYITFVNELRPLLQSVHGADRHMGKVPCRAPADTQIQLQLIRLRQELQQAVAVEDYERAARVRDQIEAMEKKR